MKHQEILDNSVEHFLASKWSIAGLKLTFHQIKGTTKILLKLLDDFLFEFNKDSHKEYVLLKILEKVKNVNFNPEDEGYIEYNEHTLQRFNDIKQIVLDNLSLQLLNLGVDLEKEMFTEEEFRSFKDELSSIARSIFELQQRQEVANEVIFNSVEEIKAQLFKDAEKGKIFGKEFVKQQMAGKVMDMTFKAGAATFLSYLPEHLSKVQKFLDNII